MIAQPPTSVVLTVLLGILAVVIPLAALVGAFLLDIISNDVNTTSRLVAYALILGSALGWLIDRGAQRLRARNAHELIRTDQQRRRFLYLRYFGDDDLKLPVTGLARRGLFQILTGWASIFRNSRFEEILTRAVAAYGPVIAIDPPDKRLKNLLSALREPAYIEYRGVRINRTCEQALTTSAHLARAYGLVPIPPGVLLIGLLNNSHAAAAGMLGLTTQEQYEATRKSSNPTHSVPPLSPAAGAITTDHHRRLDHLVRRLRRGRGSGSCLPSSATATGGLACRYVL